MGRGRPPKGPRLADDQEGSESAKRRLRIVLETVAGERTVASACAELGMGEAAFHELRSRALAAALISLEPKPRGRPPRETAEEASRIGELEEENQHLKIDLRAAQIREEMLMMPHLLKKKDAAPATEAKPPQGRKRRKKKRR
jgi:transposase-like protein